MEIKINKNEKYVVTKFIVEHTHDLVPASSSHILRSQRKIQPLQAGLINQMHSAGLKPSQIFSYMATEARRSQHLNFIEADCNNFIMRKRAEFLKKGDAKCLLEYFKQKQIGDKSFFYAIRTNSENEICGCFFCDGKSRRDYVLFGDVICFDTTFKTNNYNMVCAPIVGVNNHGQSVLFGCGLLDGETTEACMTTSQRSESINKFLNFFFKIKLIRREFVVQYDKVVVDRREKKRFVETVTTQTKRNLFCVWNVEDKASKFYTKKIFHYFQDELKKLVDWRLEFEKDDGKIRKYKVVKLLTRNLKTR
ncbi:hypothetical protein Ddye_023556 [Dipteronia dyeriana]|uniref:MULE transposase domain-containing protein n=1 Tax=Dipteronia dyeriana TaxID=168575 RepID=A0AAD9WTC6_9ROSI|nr:hypothetical protein Ddye_023556 [Dipteronia dyeriana]